ncbi:ATP-dependent RNA helicase SUPV3L1, mitochondrial isoform X2 [Nematostella vectensis]|uniref:ATP-dependent RNA helicase SUPV3L1, mitochondrial isoform X2 n=1 Tax=Nematostella vectensis TaxID=45351 RepID=UPI00139063FB|nr:ATP-dependent RNA helicase SUPV3L1, mitochondrial isoform X2 [Nematostella vectensis]
MIVLPRFGNGAIRFRFAISKRGCSLFNFRKRGSYGYTPNTEVRDLMVRRGLFQLSLVACFENNTILVGTKPKRSAISKGSYKFYSSGGNFGVSSGSHGDGPSPDDPKVGSPESKLSVETLDVDGTTPDLHESRESLESAEEELPFIPYKLWKADVDAIMWRFRADKSVQSAAKNQGLDDSHFKEIYRSFRKGMMRAMKQDIELHALMCAIDSNKAHVQELVPYFLAEGNRIFPLLGCDLDKLKKISDLRGPHDLFPEARKLRRKIIYHAGPTNSGKTHQSLKSFKTAKSAMYCAPLRLLATEVYKQTNNDGVPCDLVTGEERLWALSPDEPASHMACTVEMGSTRRHYDCVVIDEIQMMRDVERGWAWTRAFLGVVSDEVHVCGEDTAVGLIKRLAKTCGDEFEVFHYDRLSQLQVLPYSLGGQLHQVRPGDCIVAFSQRELFKLRQRIEKAKVTKCAIVYGGLPPATRVEQAAKFNNPDDEHKILIASDAIGMGLNLNIKRIIFHAMEKFDGQSVTQLTASHVKQIAGRAGRYGSEYPKGEVTTLYASSLPTLKKLMSQPSDEVQRAGLSPSVEQIEMLSHQLPNATLGDLVDLFLDVAQLDGENYFMCDLENVQYLAELVEGIPLTIWEQYSICQAPVSRNRTLSASVIVEFARRVSEKRETKVIDVKEMVRWPPVMPKSLKTLQDVEAVHEVCDVYLWLSISTFVNAFNLTRELMRCPSSATASPRCSRTKKTCARCSSLWKRLSALRSTPASSSTGSPTSKNRTRGMRGMVQMSRGNHVSKGGYRITSRVTPPHSSSPKETTADCVT